jgi:hypothetical protein
VLDEISSLLSLGLKSTLPSNSASPASTIDSGWPFFGIEVSNSGDFEDFKNIFQTVTVCLLQQHQLSPSLPGAAKHWPSSQEDIHNISILGNLKRNSISLSVDSSCYREIRMVLSRYPRTGVVLKLTMSHWFACFSSWEQLPKRDTESRRGCFGISTTNDILRSACQIDNGFDNEEY